MDNIIVVVSKNVYGSELLYPANEQAYNLADLVGTTTLTRYTLSQAKAMGFIIKLDLDREIATDTLFSSVNGV